MSFLQKSSQYLKKHHSRHPTQKNPATQHLLQKVEGFPSSLCRLCAYVCDGLLRNRLRIASTTFSTLHSVLIFLGSEPTFFFATNHFVFPGSFCHQKDLSLQRTFSSPPSKFQFMTLYVRFHRIPTMSNGRSRSTTKSFRYGEHAPPSHTAIGNGSLCLFSCQFFLPTYFLVGSDRPPPLPSPPRLCVGPQADPDNKQALVALAWCVHGSDPTQGTAARDHEFSTTNCIGTVSEPKVEIGGMSDPPPGSRVCDPETGVVDIYFGITMDTTRPFFGEKGVG